MTVISFANRGREQNEPLILLLDLQMEYAAAGRAFYLSDAEKCFTNCKRILDEARSKKLPIAHFRQLKQSTFFNQQTSFSQWIEDFRPRPNEMVFERELPSCYSNSVFESFLKQVNTPELIILGLSGAFSCLATAIDAANRGHLATYVYDASASHTLGERSEAESHQAVTEIIGLYANLSTTDDFLTRTGTMRQQAGARF